MPGPAASTASTAPATGPVAAWRRTSSSTAVRRRHVHPPGRHLRPAAGRAARAGLQPVLMMATRIGAALVLALLPQLASAGGLNRTYLVPSFRTCPGPQTCFPPAH